MKPTTFITALLLLTSCAAKRLPSSAFGTFTDTRDGQVYKTIKIGTQIWMAQNLNFKNDGAEYYNGDPANGPIYGMLYSFQAAKVAAPKGWHLPSEAEWELMESACQDPVFMMNITVYGGEYGTGRFYSLNKKATFYTSTQVGNPAITRFLDKNDYKFRINRQGGGWHLSVRCVRDEPAE